MNKDKQKAFNERDLLDGCLNRMFICDNEIELFRLTRDAMHSFLQILNYNKQRLDESGKVVYAEFRPDKDNITKLIERDTAIAPNEDNCCPLCNTYAKDDNGVAGNFCPNCGQRLNWEST